MAGIQTNLADYEKKQGNLTPDDQPIDEADEAIEIINVSEYQPRLIPSKQWRECIKKFYEKDTLYCPKCANSQASNRTFSFTDTVFQSSSFTAFRSLLFGLLEYFP